MLDASKTIFAVVLVALVGCLVAPLFGVTNSLKRHDIDGAELLNVVFTPESDQEFTFFRVSGYEKMMVSLVASTGNMSEETVTVDVKWKLSNGDVLVSELATVNTTFSLKHYTDRLTLVLPNHHDATANVTANIILK
jgi:hypothetical protein